MEKFFRVFMRQLPVCIKNGDLLRWTLFFILALMVSLLIVFLLGTIGEQVFAATSIRLPGTDESSKLETAGTLLRLVDTAIFSWGARLFAGLCVFCGAWAIKEQRFAMGGICIFAAIVIGTVPLWIKNIFDIGGGGSIFQ